MCAKHLTELLACRKHLGFGDCLLLTRARLVTGFVCYEKKLLQVRARLSLLECGMVEVGGLSRLSPMLSFLVHLFLRVSLPQPLPSFALRPLW